MDELKRNPYLLRRIEEAGGYFSASFSNRYMNWKRHRSIEEAVGRELARLEKNGQKEARILDAGCGDGVIVFKLKARFDATRAIHFTGVDLSDLDIDFANQRKKYFGHQRCDFIRADLAQAPLDEDSFDIVINTEVIEHIPDPEILLAQMRRFLKKGGLLILTTPNEGGGILAHFLRQIKRFFLGRRVRWEKEVLDGQIVHPVEKERTRFSSAGGQTGAGHEHISVKKLPVWKRLFVSNGFSIDAIRGTAGLLFGDPFLDRHRILFAFCLVLDAVLEVLPWSYLWSECLFFELRKKA